MTLKTYLKRQGISEAEFARKLGVPSIYVNRWANGKIHPRIENLKRISEATDGAVGPEDFFPIEDEHE